MNKKNKIIIIIAIILIIIIGIIVISNTNKENSNNSDNVNNTETTNQISTKKSNGTFQIYNTDIKTNTGSTKLTATIKNISGNKTERQKIEIVLIDKDGNEVGTIFTTIPKLDVNGSTEISAEDLKVYENIYDFKIK